MAKQTFTSGQVLSAAQMNSLQGNDYNQTVSAKVASYTLVAADAGTRITMSNASATTITVNTGLFAAGDTLVITNIGAGVCTITAGTATVSTISSLALAQYDSGVLYFTSTGVAIWQKYSGAVASSGMSWAQTVAEQTISAATTYTFSSLSNKKAYVVLLRGINPTAGLSQTVKMELNGDSTNKYQTFGWRNFGSGSGREVVYDNLNSSFDTGTKYVSGDSDNVCWIEISEADSAGFKKISLISANKDWSSGAFVVASLEGWYQGTGTVSSIKFTFSSSVNGYIRLYGAS